MFLPDIIQLRQFYASMLGRVVQHSITSAVQRLWPNATGEVLLGIGYATPYLDSYLSSANCVAAAMPAQQGAAYWPSGGNNLAFLTMEGRLPIESGSVNRVLLVHALESTEQLRCLLEEVWRVLTPGGRMLAVVPNRHGVWARSPRSPFGTGRPFSVAQLKELLLKSELTPTRHSMALYTPPVYTNALLKAARWFERFGEVLGVFGGVLLIEAEKQIYAALKDPVVIGKGYRLLPSIKEPVRVSTSAQRDAEQAIS